MTTSELTEAKRESFLETLIRQTSKATHSGEPETLRRTIALAEWLQSRAAELQTPQERRQQAELDRLLQHPADKATLVEMTDQAFRSKRAARATDQLTHVLDAQGIPRFFSPVERGLLAGFRTFGGYLPGVAMPLVRDQMQRETANVVLPADPGHLRRHLVARRGEGLRMNVNHLGEALLGEGEAASRLDGYAAMLAREEVEVISVKVSTLYSQINPVARRHTVGVLADRLRRLFGVAACHRFVRPDGTKSRKLVYVDMEEYRDMQLTFEAFKLALDGPEQRSLTAGVVLQAYLPDAYAVQKELNAWARQRCADGGAPITLRLVKGANMEMERVEASVQGWPVAPFQAKVDTDANYLRMLREAMRAENLAAVRVGVASHNLFSLSYALVLAAESDALDGLQFEMLEGMANHQRRALAEVVPDMLLYAPACHRDEFLHAIGYLVRRLDENTGPDNFLRHAFSVSVGDGDWERLSQQFTDATRKVERLGQGSHRDQHRDTPPASRLQRPESISEFVNEPDTDWTLPHHAGWAQSIVDRWRDRCDASCDDVPLEIAGETIRGNRATRTSLDPSRPGVVVARFQLAEKTDIDRAVAAARSDPSGWRLRTAHQRAETLARVAETIAERRADLLGAMLAEGGKLLNEGDPEVSEAIDFCRFYGASAIEWAEHEGLREQGGGVVAVVSPWNFPLAIPAGGVAAALAAGSTVILKPASYTVMTAYHLCRCFWDAGVPRGALQFAPCDGATAGEALVKHPGVDHVLLTGGTATARRMLAARPEMRLSAETGGKNATIVTALADRELAVKHVVHSAFGHGGQKCSATSLLILEDEVYHDNRFRDLLIDAVSSLAVGPAWELPTRMGPLIAEPTGDLKRGLTNLEPGQSWAVEPRLRVRGNPCLVSPGVKWGVAPGQDAHLTEYFGPMLGVMRARDLTEAIDLVNQTGYGLTSGIESLDDREHDQWLGRIRAGNLYINRPTTGAIVLRQPFGGMGLSSVGPGVKAGGPNYVVPLMDLEAKATPAIPATSKDRSMASLLGRLREEEIIDEIDYGRLLGATESYRLAAETEFLAKHDHFELLGQDNVRRYLPFERVIVRLHEEDCAFDILARLAASRSVGARAVISCPRGMPRSLCRFVDQIDAGTQDWGGDVEFVVEGESELVRRLGDDRFRVRYAGRERVPATVRKQAAAGLHYLADAAVSPIGRLELLWYVREQSISHDYHRYGNLGRRAGEPRGVPQESHASH